VPSNGAAAAEHATAAARRAEAAVAQQAATIERLDAQLSTLHRAWRGDVARLEEQVQRQREALDRALGDRLKLQQAHASLQARVAALERVALGRTSAPSAGIPLGAPTTESSSARPLDLPEAVAEILAAAGVPPPCVTSASVPCISAADLVSILRVAPHVRAAVEPHAPASHGGSSLPRTTAPVDISSTLSMHATPKASRPSATRSSSRGSSPAATHLAHARAAFLYGAMGAPAPVAASTSQRTAPSDEGHGAAFGAVADAAATTAAAACVAAEVFPPPQPPKASAYGALHTPASSHHAAPPAPPSPAPRDLDTSEKTPSARHVTAWGGMRPQSSSPSTNGNGSSGGSSYNPSTTPSVSRGGRGSSESAPRSGGAASTPSAARQRLDAFKSAFKGTPVSSAAEEDGTSQALGYVSPASVHEQSPPPVDTKKPTEYNIGLEYSNVDADSAQVGASEFLDAFPDPPHGEEPRGSFTDGPVSEEPSAHPTAAPVVLHAAAAVGSMGLRGAARDSSSPSTDLSDGDVTRRILARRGARGAVAPVARPTSYETQVKPTGTARVEDSDEEW
jgi:hypothetical protein